MTDNPRNAILAAGLFVDVPIARMLCGISFIGMPLFAAKLPQVPGSMALYL